MKTAIIGGGAAGSLAAILLARENVKVTLFEKNDRIGRKLFITGKGRCNLTNDCKREELPENIVRGEKFLRSAFAGFSPRDTMEFFSELGVPLKVERGNRVFPASDKSSDVIRALQRELARLGVDVRLNARATGLTRRKDGDEYKYVVKYVSDDSDAEEKFDMAIVATGGLSYPLTGSTGDGYAFAKKLGIGVADPAQALVPLYLEEDVAPLNGISLKNVRLTAFSREGKEICSQFGEMMFTYKGVTGPIALSVSSYIARMGQAVLKLDFKPAVDEDTLDARLLREFAERKNQDIKNASRALLPERLNLFALQTARIDPSKKVNAITKEERARLIRTLKGMQFHVLSAAPFSEAIITAGGIELKELTPKCECKALPGLYFVGEVIDADALTGGFNLQIAWATAAAAARDIISKT